MLNGEELNFLRKYLNSKELVGYPNTFVLGSLDKQKSVATQQILALTMALGLSERFNPKTHRFAVIGAGFSGIALSAELLRRGFSLDLYEKSQDLFSSYVSGNASYVHPNLYNWPDQPFEKNSFSTESLKWHSGTMSKVSWSIKAEFDKAVNLNPSKCRFFFGCEVCGFNLLQSFGAPPQYSIEHRNGDSNTVYNVVISAIGFGWEARCADAPQALGYWEPFTGLSLGTLDKPERLLISGKGDRALIDILNASLKCFDPERIFEFLPQLASSSVRAAVRDIEYCAVRSKGELDIFAEYEALFAHQGWTRNIREFDVNMTRNVFCNARPAGVFSRKSSPLNRVLVYFLVKEQIVSLRHYDLEECTTLWEDDSPTSRVRILCEEKGEAEDFDRAVLRHGIQPDYFWRTFPFLQETNGGRSDHSSTQWTLSDLPKGVLAALGYNSSDSFLQPSLIADKRATT